MMPEMVLALAIQAATALTRAHESGITHRNRAGRRLSRAVMGNVRQNLFRAFVNDILGVPVAAGVPHRVRHEVWCSFGRMVEWR